MAVFDTLPSGHPLRAGPRVALAAALLLSSCAHIPWLQDRLGGSDSGREPDSVAAAPPAAVADAPDPEVDSAAGAEGAPAAEAGSSEPTVDREDPEPAVPGARDGEGVAEAVAPILPAEASWADETLAGLSLRQKVGQMLMPLVLGNFSPEGTEDHDRIVELIRENEIGGVIVSVGAPVDVALKLNDLQQHSRLPLLVASDLENGPGFRFAGAVHLPGVVELGGATAFPPLMAVGATGDPAFAYEIGRVTAREARALGIHVPFAPVLDVNNNAENPVINVRSFGEDAGTVARLGVSFIRGLQEHGALATGKHFPGHGDTETDSHVRLPVISVSRQRLEEVELYPFRRAVEAGMGAVMTAHVAVPEITGSPDLPATLSHAVLTGLLREGMGFRGLIFTDAMDMGAVSGRFPRGEAAVRAVEAGADVVLMPPSVAEAQDALVDAVRSGRISEARIDASARRILAAKEGLELHRGAEVSLDALPRTVGVPDHTHLAREVAERSITLVRNGRNLLPLLGTRSADVVSVTYRRPNDLLAGKHFDAELRDTYRRLRSVRLDRDTPRAVYDELAHRVRGADLVVVSLHVSQVAGDDDPALPDEIREFVELLERRRTPHIAISFGNPYLIGEIADVQAYLLAWGGTRHSQEAAAKALFGDIGTRGRLPIEIPPLFSIGEGIRIGGEARQAGGR